MSSLLSARWHRVADLAPRLAPQVRVRRLRLRGETWIVLADPASGRSVRRSMTSASIPSAARLSAASSARPTPME